MPVRVKCNGVRRPIVHREDVPSDILAREFDWLEPDKQGNFFKYKGVWYELGEFVPANITGWDAIATQTYFSGVVIRFCDQGESVVCGWAFW